jgi:hypothetical protein
MFALLRLTAVSFPLPVSLLLKTEAPVRNIWDIWHFNWSFYKEATAGTDISSAQSYKIAVSIDVRCMHPI